MNCLAKNCNNKPWKNGFCYSKHRKLAKDLSKVIEEKQCGHNKWIKKTTNDTVIDIELCSSCFRSTRYEGNNVEALEFRELQDLENSILESWDEDIDHDFEEEEEQLSIDRFTEIILVMRIAMFIDYVFNDDVDSDFEDN